MRSPVFRVCGFDAYLVPFVYHVSDPVWLGIHACDVLHGIFWLLSQKMSNVNESEGRFEASPAMRRTGAGEGVLWGWGAVKSRLAHYTCVHVPVSPIRGALFRIAGVRTSKHREGGRDRHSFGQKHGARASVPLGRGRGESQPAHSRSSQELGRMMSGVIDVHRTSCRAQASHPDQPPHGHELAAETPPPLARL